MKRLPSFRAATVGVAAIAAGAAVSLAPAMAVPIRGVQPSITRSAEGGPRRPGPVTNGAAVSNGASVAKGRPMVFAAPTNPSYWLLGMKR